MEQALQCPKCKVVLEQKKYMERDISICPECEGALVFQKDLNFVLEKLYAHLMEKIDFSGKIQTVPDKEVRIYCPCCGGLMDQNGYMGSKQVIIDRCSNCSVIYMDKHELGVMALLIGQLKKKEGLEFSNEMAIDVLSIGAMNQVMRTGVWLYLGFRNF